MKYMLSICVRCNYPLLLREPTHKEIKKHKIRGLSLLQHKDWDSGSGVIVKDCKCGIGDAKRIGITVPYTKSRFEKVFGKI